jgi:parallel beta-helix repeat protein
MNRLFAMTIAGSLFFGVSAHAGDINPPAGPIAATHKTLTEVEPRIAISLANTPGDADSLFKITQPGSYYLTGNITGVAGKHGIEIASGGAVSLDLNGFVLAGVVGSLDGVRVAISSGGVHISNGTTRLWGGDGLNLVSALSARVSGVIAQSNAGQGIRAASTALITSCVARSNGSIGISCMDGCTVSDCTIVGSGGMGLVVMSYSAITNCSSSYNESSGISTLAGCTITGCTSGYNLGTGRGIVVTSGCTVSNCTVTQNFDDGIHANDNCTISGNTVRNNGDDGIEIENGNTVSRNTCVGNDTAGDGAGVYTTGIGNRIEDNSLITNRYGLNCSGTDNFIVKNTARGNAGGNFIALGINELAPVITNPGSNGFATMTPWSNVSY